MGVLFNIISHSAGNFFLGVLLTLAGVLLMFFIIRSWFVNRTFTPLSYGVGIILFLFLSFQAILLCGAVTIRSYIVDVETAINDRVSDVPESVQPDSDNSREIVEMIQNKWPLATDFIDEADFSDYTPSDIASVITGELRAGLTRYIWRRAGWSLLFVSVAAFAVIKTMEQTGRRHRAASSRVGSSGGRHRRRSRHGRYDDF